MNHALLMKAILLYCGVTEEQHTDVRSEEHTSELQSRETISYAVFCLKKKKKKKEKKRKEKKKKEKKNNE